MSDHVCAFSCTVADEQARALLQIFCETVFVDDCRGCFCDLGERFLDSDKVMWATTVLGQELPWTNVCDTRAKSATVYNLQTLPSAFVICNGELVDGNVVDEAEFRKLLDKLLK